MTWERVNDRIFIFEWTVPLIIVITNTNSYKHLNFDTNFTAKGFNSADAFSSCFLLNLLKCCGQVFERKKKERPVRTFFLLFLSFTSFSPQNSFLSFFLAYWFICFLFLFLSLSVTLCTLWCSGRVFVFWYTSWHMYVCMYVCVILYVVYRCIYVCVIVAVGVLYICAFDG